MIKLLYGLVLLLLLAGLAQAQQSKSVLDPMALANANQGLLDAGYGHLIAQSGTLTMDTSQRPPAGKAHFDLICVNTKTNGLVRVRATIVPQPKWHLTDIKILQ